MKWIFLRIPAAVLLCLFAAAPALNLLHAQGIYIQPGASLTVQSGAAIVTTGTAGLTLRSTSAGTGSLIDYNASGGITVAGTTSAERYIGNDNGWHFLSTPLSGADIWPDFAPAPTGTPLNFGASGWKWDLYYWNPNCLTSTGYLPWVNLRKANGDYNDAAVEAAGNDAGFGTLPGDNKAEFQAGRGYLAAYAPEYSGTTHTFTGSLNFGSKSVAVSLPSNPWNLVGNPYPSAVDWQAPSGWSRSGLITSGSGYDMWIFNPATGNYGVCNSASGDGTNDVSRYIAPMQAFFVEASSAFNLGMTSAVQVHSTQAWLKSSEEADNQLQLKLTTQANSYSDEMIVAVNRAFADGGSEKFWSIVDEAPELCAVRGDKFYSIDRLPSVDETSTVTIRVRAGVASTYTLTAVGANRFYTAKTVILDDLKTGGSQELKVNPVYTFTASPADPPERLRLRFAGPYSTGDPGAQPGFSVRVSGHAIGLVSTTAAGLEGTAALYNILGQKMLSLPLSGHSTVLNIDGPAGYYILTVTASSRVTTRKVFVE